MARVTPVAHRCSMCPAYAGWLLTPPIRPAGAAWFCDPHYQWQREYQAWVTEALLRLAS